MDASAAISRASLASCSACRKRSYSETRPESSACSRESFLNCSMSRVAFSDASSPLMSFKRPTRLSSLVRKVDFTSEGWVSLDAEEARDGVGERAALVAGRLVERLRRRMQQLVGEALRQGFQHARGSVAPLQEAQRALQLLAARLLALLAQRADQRHAFARLHPVHELSHLGLDDHLGLLDRGAPRVAVVGDHLREIIHGVQE